MLLIPTDSVIQDIILGVVGNGLWSLLAQSGAKLTGQVRKLVCPPEPAMVITARQALEQVAREIAGPTTYERFAVYFASPELEAIVRQMFATSLVGPIESRSLKDVKRRFVLSMSKHLDIDEARLESFALSFLEAVVASVDATLNLAIEKNLLSAHEAKSAIRHRLLHDEIAALHKSILLFESNTSLDVKRILDFEEKYREIIGDVHAFIKPPHLESGRRVPIDDIFVAPRIVTPSTRKTEESELLALPSFLAAAYRAVLLGNPGAGKSTTSAKICHDLATRYAQRLFAGRELTPVLVVLREYGGQKKTTNCSIVEFLEQQANSRYQIKPPERAFEYLLLNGRLVVIFDGLDELLDSSYRQEITSNVETFSKLYPSVPVLVTSREVGYDQAPLNEKVFSMYRLAPFNERQVREYATKWFDRDEDYSAEQKRQKAEAFFSDSSFVPDLRSNPLMLGLMCNLYRVEGYIPRNRPEVYGKCSVMLFERWDKSRDILVSLPFEEHIRPAMQDLAFWIYSNDRLQGGVSEHDLIERTSEYLRTWVFDDIQKARVAACNFVQFCTGRAWVFTDTGTTREGERLFQFTHRTFLEYFTACYLVSIHPTPESLIAALAPRIAKGEWDVVAQLACQIQSKQVQGAADELLGQLLRHDAPASDRGNVLSFCERSLEFLVPSPRMRRDITRAALTFWLSVVQGSQRSHAAQHGKGRRESIEHVGNILLATAENRDTIADEIKTFLQEGITSGDGTVSALTAELALVLPFPLHHIEFRREAPREVTTYWEGVSEHIAETSSARLREIASSDLAVALRCYWRGLISISEGVSRFGLRFVLVSPRSPALGDVWFFPVAYSLADTVLGWRLRRRQEEDEDRRRVDELRSLAATFLKTPTPWIEDERDAEGRPLGWFLRSNRRDSIVDPLPLSSDLMFSVICILAVDLESAELKPKDVDEVAKLVDVLPEQVGAILLARVSETARNEASRVLSSSTLNVEQQDFLMRWVAGEINLRRQRKRPASKLRRTVTRT